MYSIDAASLLSESLIGLIEGSYYVKFLKLHPTRFEFALEKKRGSGLFLKSFPEMFQLDLYLKSKIFVPRL